MEYNVCKDTIVVRLDKGDKIAESLLSVAKKEKVTLAYVSGIGAVDDFETGVFDLTTSEYKRFRYTGNHEINSIIGNLTTKNGNPYLHLHITCTGCDGKVVGGHLFEGTVSLTAEIFLQKAEGKAERKFDETLGINRISFD